MKVSTDSGRRLSGGDSGRRLSGGVPITEYRVPSTEYRVGGGVQRDVRGAVEGVMDDDVVWSACYPF